MKIIVKEEEIYGLEKKLLDYISNINSELNEIEKIKSNLSWEGLAYNSFISRYDEVIQNEKRQIAKLESLIKFLDDVSLNYGMAQDNVKGNYSNVPEFNGVIGNGLTKYNINRNNSNLNMKNGRYVPSEDVIRAAEEKAKARSNYHGW